MTPEISALSGSGRGSIDPPVERIRPTAWQTTGENPVLPPVQNISFFSPSPGTTTTSSCESSLFTKVQLFPPRVKLFLFFPATKRASSVPIISPSGVTARNSLPPFMTEKRSFQLDLPNDDSAPGPGISMSPSPTRMPKSSRTPSRASISRGFISLKAKRPLTNLLIWDCEVLRFLTISSRTCWTSTLYGFLGGCSGSTSFLLADSITATMQRSSQASFRMQAT